MKPWITEPGQYDLSEAEYHSDPVVDGSLSSTGARTLIDRTAAHFAYEREHGRADTDDFRFGRAAHSVVLGAGAEVVVVEGSAKAPNSWTTNDAKAAVAAAEEAGQVPVKPKERKALDAMAAAIRDHPTAGPLFARPGRAEQSFVARDPETGVMCRVRVDWMPDVAEGDQLLVVDYKTTQVAEPGAFARSMGSYGYHQQGPFYCDALTWLGLAGDLEPQFVLVAQEKTPPYLVTVTWPDQHAVEWGRVLNRKARDTYRTCTAVGVWPGYPTEPAALQLPGWLDAAYAARHAAGEFDTTADRLIGASA